MKKYESKILKKTTKDRPTKNHAGNALDDFQAGWSCAMEYVRDVLFNLRNMSKKEAKKTFLTETDVPVVTELPK